MPDFARAEISSTGEDLTEYKAFLRKLKVGEVVTLPLEHGETSRKVMRALNAAAAQSNLRLARLASGADAVRFKVAPPEKRSVNISPEARRARVEKARATRAARRPSEGPGA
jgi:hypothetical protein